MSAPANLSGGQMIHDEYGNPYLILEEQSKQKRAHGIEAHKANIIAAKAVAESIRTSLGPKGRKEKFFSKINPFFLVGHFSVVLTRF